MIMLINRATQKVEETPLDNVYHFRTEDDVRRLVHFMFRGNELSRKPFYTSGRGVLIQYGEEYIFNSFMYVQFIYNKLSGLRVREQILMVTKDELDSRNFINQIIALADRFSDYYFYQGFQCIYSIFEQEDRYSIVYAINSVSYQDGHKYSHNDHAIADRDQCATEAALMEIKGENGEKEFDYCTLEYCPLYITPQGSYSIHQ